MLSFRWVLGDMTDNSPGEIPALLADLANADEEHVDVGFEKGDYGVGILVDRWIYISDLDEDSLSPCSFRAPDDEMIVYENLCAFFSDDGELCGSPNHYRIFFCGYSRF